MGLHSMGLTSGYSLRHGFLWTIIAVGLLVIAPEGYAKNSKSMGIRFDVNKGAVDAISVSKQTEIDAPAASAPKPQPQPKPNPQSVPQAQVTPSSQQANTNQSLQQQYTTLSLKVQQLMMQINQQQMQINQHQAQINQLSTAVSQPATQPAAAPKTHTCYINESSNTYIGEGATQVAAKAKTLSQCKANNGWCKPDTLVCD